MKLAFSLSVLLLATSPARADDGSLRNLLISRGFGGAKLERRWPNHLVVPATINAKHAGLLLDTGAPISLIDRNSVNTLGLQVTRGKGRLGGVYGMNYEKYGVAHLRSLTLGNLVFSNVPVAVEDQSVMNHYSSLRHLDGILGLHEMKKYGAVIDCTRQMLYISPSGSSAATTRALDHYLTGQGFTRVAMELHGGLHLRVKGGINGHEVSFIVDTGAGTTDLERTRAISHGISPRTLKMGSEAPSGRFEVIDSGTAKALAIGSFEISNADVTLSNIDNHILAGAVGLLGEENLSFHFAVIDVGGMNLYLRHADKKS